jgi:hypothetical protein
VAVPHAEVAGEALGILLGHTVPFTPEQVSARYSDHDGFVSAWKGATQDAVRAGFIVNDDSQHIKVVAAQSSVLK